MRRIRILRNCCFPLALLLAITVMVTCGSDPPPFNTVDRAFTTAHRLPQGYIDLPTEELPNMILRMDWADAYYEPLDSDSIEMYTYGEQTVYHAVNMSHRCITFIAAYHGTGKKTYLDRAEKYAAKIMVLCNWIDGLPYLPCTFRYAVHKDSSIAFSPPWYSGMAQGEWISVMVRLYEITGKQDYLDFAGKLVKTLTRLSYNHDAWVARIDEAGFYWIEEYPHNDRPGQTLNGFAFAIIGAYDYYRVTEDQQAWIIWELCLTTLKHYLPQYRKPGEGSYYCLGHGHLANEGYHVLHMRQMRQLAAMSGDDFFNAMHCLFEKDYEKAKEDGEF